MKNIQYHKKFKNINPDVISLVKQKIEGGFFKMNDTDKLESLKEINRQFSTIYNVPVCDLKIKQMEAPGFYTQNVIVMNKPSLVTYLHEFKHHLDTFKGTEIKESASRGWSHSVFYQASPKQFKRSVKKGLLIWQKEFEE